MRGDAHDAMPSDHRTFPVESRGNRPCCYVAPLWVTVVVGAVLQIRLSGNLRVKSVNAESGATVLPDGAGIRWTSPRGTHRFEAVEGG